MLLDQLDGIGRVVLLGDAIELRQGPLREAFAAARPFFEALGEKLGADGEVILVPGNHDHLLVAPWLERRHRDAAPPPLELAETAAWEPHDPVAALAEWLAPARFTLAYPGVWLRDDVYATHGHFLDRHTTVPTFERLGAGAMGRLVGALPSSGVGPDDYEAALAPIYAWIDALAQNAGEHAQGTHGASARAWRTLAAAGDRSPLRRRVLTGLFPFGIAAINRAGIGPLRADLSGEELRRAGVRAMGETVRALEIPAAYVIFGHTHRAGPRPGDDSADWSVGDTHLLNSGCWVYEPSFAGTAPYASPYWPGVGIVVEEEFPLAPPESRRMLEGHSSADLRTPRDGDGAARPLRPRRPA